MIPIIDPTNRDNKLELTILYTVGKQYKKIAKATIQLYKKYFLGNNTSTRKWIHMELFKTSFESLSPVIFGMVMSVMIRSN
mgnify:CR=1 FL=1